LFEVDKKGHRLYPSDDSSINIPAIGAALVKNVMLLKIEM
jgi:hypothetical protein